MYGLSFIVLNPVWKELLFGGYICWFMCNCYILILWRGCSCRHWPLTPDQCSLRVSPGLSSSASSPSCSASPACRVSSDDDTFNSSMSLIGDILTYYLLILGSISSLLNGSSSDCGCCSALSNSAWFCSPGERLGAAGCRPSLSGDQTKQFISIFFIFALFCSL